MNRLVHSTGGSLRSMQISSKQLFVFVEGGLDRVFYDRLLRFSKVNMQNQYEIRAAKELPNGMGGKVGLTQHFDELKRRGALQGSALGKSYTSVFVFDKDIDDLTRKKLRSKHALYTNTYDLEGHLLMCGDLIDALASAAQITLEQAKRVIGDPSSFLQKIAITWSDWIALCILSHIHSISVGCSYTLSSQINTNGLGPTDISERDKYLVKLSNRTGQSVDELRRRMEYYSKAVKSEARKGNPFKFFRGKWMKTIFQEDVAKRIVAADAQVHGLSERLLAILVANIGGANCSCCTLQEDAFKQLLT